MRSAILAACLFWFGCATGAGGGDDAPSCEVASDCQRGWACCSGGCRDLGSDADHCGVCGEGCAAGETCDTGQCVGGTGGTCDPPCTGGLDCCARQCVDMDTNPQFCGACGAQCNDEEECIAGTCTDPGALCDPVCENPEECCDGACTNTRTDPLHCGSCETPCPAGQACVSDTCTECLGGPCAASETCCDDECIDISRDENNCGGCGNDCESGLDCVDGECSCDGVACGDGEGCCGGTCTNLDDDPENCGRCGSDCAMEGGDSCNGGTCGCGGGALCDDGGLKGQCFPGLSQVCCGGACVAVDDSHCGDCDTVCDPDLAPCLPGFLDPTTCSCGFGF